jgi:hypothetical protein
LRLAEIIWESLAAIDERLAEHERDPDNVISRDEVLAEAKRR